MILIWIGGGDGVYAAATVQRSHTPKLNEMTNDLVVAGQRENCFSLFKCMNAWICVCVDVPLYILLTLRLTPRACFMSGFQGEYILPFDYTLCRLYETHRNHVCMLFAVVCVPYKFFLCEKVK